MTVSVGKQRVLYILLVFQKGIISSITISLQRISFEKTKWDETFNQNLKPQSSLRNKDVQVPYLKALISS